MEGLEPIADVPAGDGIAERLPGLPAGRLRFHLVIGVRKGAGVIARVWRGWTRAADAHQYDAHYHGEVLPGLGQIPGFRGARLLRRTVAGETEFVSVTFFDDVDAIRAFAGPEFEKAVVAEDARRVLVRFDDRVIHYEVSAAT